MRKASIAAIGVMLCLCGTSTAAHAGSRFATGADVPATAAVRFDFTIIIPAIVTLQIGPLADAAATQDLKLSVPTSSADLPESTATSRLRFPQLAAHASTNAGILAIGAPAPPWDGQSVSIDTHPAIFLVALP